MPLWIQGLVDMAGLLLLALAVVLAAGGRQGAHSGPVKPAGAPYAGEHVPGAPRALGPEPAYVAAYVARGGAHPRETLERVLEGLRAL